MNCERSEGHAVEQEMNCNYFHVCGVGVQLAMEHFEQFQSLPSLSRHPSRLRFFTLHCVCSRTKSTRKAAVG